MLYPDVVVELSRTGVAAGLTMCMVTNAKWARWDSETQKTVVALRDAGLAFVSVSVDRFHADQVALDRPLRLLEACRVTGLAYRVAPTRLPGEDLESLAAYRIIRDACHPVYEPQDVLPLGRARNLFNHWSWPPLGKTACPVAQNTIVDADGSVYPCCVAPGLSESERAVLRVGNIIKEYPNHVFARMNLLRTALLRAFGPLLLMEWVARCANLEGPPKFKFICDACVALHSGQWKAPFARFAQSPEARARLAGHRRAKRMANAAASTVGYSE